MKNNSDLFYICSLIEFIGRQQNMRRSEVVRYLGRENLSRIYHYADVLHCELIGKVADEYISIARIPKGNFDNVAQCKYEIPDYWTIGEVYERLIEDIVTYDEKEKSVVEVLEEVYGSWIDESISNYNSDFFYQSRQYIFESYRAGEPLLS